MTSLPSPAADVGRWAAGLVAAAVVLFTAALVDRVHCRLTDCHDLLGHRLFDLDAIDGLPRLFIVGLFVALAAVSFLGARAAAGRVRLWWAAVAALGAVLAVAKLTSVHSAAKSDDAALTLVLGLALAGCGLAVLWALARRWGVVAGTPLAITLAGYVLAALGLDVLTGLAAEASGRSGLLLDAAATFVEELGEALAAVWVLVTALRWRPPSSSRCLERRDQGPRSSGCDPRGGG